jgi:hypothetical protein
MIDPETPETPEDPGTDEPNSPDLETADDGIEVSGPEVELEPENDVETEEFSFEETDPPKTGLGLLPVLGLTLLAAILGAIGGAVGGAYGTQYVTPPADVNALRAEFQKEMSQVKSQLNSETQNAVNALRTELNGLKTQTSRTDVGDDLQPALTALNKRVQALEAAPDSKLTDIDPKTINALKSAQKDGFKWPETDAMESDVADLKSTSTDLKSQIEALNVELKTLETKFDSLSSVPANISSDADLTKFDGPVFPKQALLQAAKTKADSQGLLARTLHKHVHIDRPDSPKNLINKIETAYGKGDVYTAIKTFDRLPSDIRIAGQDWRDAADRLK